MDNTVNTENGSEKSISVDPEEKFNEKNSEATIITGDDFPRNIEVCFIDH